jgi:hypothetical protein
MTQATSARLRLIRSWGSQAPTPSPNGEGGRAAAWGGAVALVLRLTLLALVLQPGGPPVTRAATLVVAGLGLVSPRLLHAPALWLGLAGLVGLRLLLDWPLADNHIYLTGYWCLAVAFGLRAPGPGAALATAGRLLVGLAFAFAVLWKGVLSPDYLDGRFFRVTLLTDPRFEDAAVLLGQLTPAALDTNRQALRPLPDAVEPVDGPRLTEPRAFTWLAGAATWGMLALEAAVAAAFLAGLPASATWVRHAALLLFAATAYAFAPVAGFGFVLLAMGLAQCGPAQAVWRGLYLASFGLVVVYREIPWAYFVLEALRRLQG